MNDGQGRPRPVKIAFDSFASDPIPYVDTHKAEPVFRHGQHTDNLHKSAAKRGNNSSDRNAGSLYFAWRKSWWRGQDLNLRPLGYELTVGLVFYSLV